MGKKKSKSYWKAQARFWKAQAENDAWCPKMSGYVGSTDDEGRGLVFTFDGDRGWVRVALSNDDAARLMDDIRRELDVWLLEREQARVSRPSQDERGDYERFMLGDDRERGIS